MVKNSGGDGAAAALQEGVCERDGENAAVVLEEQLVAETLTTLEPV